MNLRSIINDTFGRLTVPRLSQSDMSILRLAHMGDEERALAVDRVIQNRGKLVPELAPFLTTTPIYPNSDYAAAVNHGYIKNELIHAGLRQIINVFAQAKISVVDKSGQSVEDHDLVKLFRSPAGLYAKPRSFEYELWEWTLLDLFLSGNCYWYKNRSQSGKVVALRRLQPDRVAILPDENSFVARYFYEVSGNWSAIRTDDIVHWKFPHPGTDPLDRYFGLSPIIVAMRAIATDNEMTDFTKTVFQNYAIPGVVIEAAQAVKPETASEIRRAFRERYRRGGRGDVAVLQKGMTVKSIGMNMDELAFKDVRGSTETRILMVLGGSALIYLAGALSGMEKNSFANYAEARESLADDVIGPLWNRFDDGVTQNLLPDFDRSEQLTAQFDTKNVPAFESRRISRLEVASKAFISGLVDHDEARTIVGYKAVHDKKKFFYIPFNVRPVFMDSNGDMTPFNADPIDSSSGDQSGMLGGAATDPADVRAN